MVQSLESPLLLSYLSSPYTGYEYKPGFGVYFGRGYRNYQPGVTYTASSTDPSPMNKTVAVLSWGVGAQLANLKDTISLWGEAGMYSGLDKGYRLGLIAELALGRRLQLLGGINYMQNHTPWTRLDPSAGQIEYTSTSPGVGAQYDVFIGPHYSVGVRGFLEKDLFSLTLAINLEPAPPQRLSNLNYKQSVW